MKSFLAACGQIFQQAPEPEVAFYWSRVAGRGGWEVGAWIKKWNVPLIGILHSLLAR